MIIRPPIQHRRAGFTLIEALMSVLLLALAMTTAIVSLSFMIRNERLVSAEGDLDLDSRLLIERMRRDLWLTSREMIVMHPPGLGPYTAMSFPVVSGEGLIERDADGNILWDATVVYHLWDGTPPEVRRTVISPRVNLSDENRQQQLADIVVNGSAQGTFNGANGSTRAVVANLVDWKLNITASRFDAYAPEAGRRSISLGSALLNNGPQQIMFRVAGKNPANTGAAQHLGVDSLIMSPSALPREAEWQTVAAYQGIQPSAQFMGEGERWSGNARLWFPAIADGSFFTLTLDNDRWEERNFFDNQVVMSNLVRVAVPPAGGLPSTFGLQLVGNTNVWLAAQQLDPVLVNNEMHTNDFGVRVLLRGTDILINDWGNFNGGWINFDGTNVTATFQSAPPLIGTSVFLRIERAFIAESAAPGSAAYAMDYIPTTRTNFSFGGSSAPIFSGTITSDRMAFHIQKDKSYIVGMFLKSIYDWRRNPRVWEEQNPGDVPSSFIIDGGINLTQFMDPQWSTRTDVIATNKVYALRSLWAGYAPQGVYISQIIDTRVANPAYGTFTWSSDTPGNSSITMQVRAGNQWNLSDATDWETAPEAESGFVPLLNGRFVQVRAVLRPSPEGLHTPQLRDFTVRWETERRIVDLAGIFSVGPDHGIYELLINGVPLLQGVTIDLEVFRVVSMGFSEPRRLTSKAYAEIVPRNAGR